MSLKDKVKEAFDKADTEKTGKISMSQLESVLKSLNASISADELKMIEKKLDCKDGFVKFDDFVNVFCGNGGPPGLRRELSKPVPPEQLEVIKAAFKQFDTDASGSICVSELQAMCTSLGKKLNDGQAKAAMQQLDKNGDDKVDFEEFLLWWTCTPGLGGYDHVALSYMKAKLALKMRAKTVFAKVSRKKIENPNEFVWRGSIDLTPNYLNGRAGSDEKAGVTIQMKKLDAPKDSEGPRVTIKLQGKDADAVAKTVAKYDVAIEKLKAMDPSTPIYIKAVQDKNFLNWVFQLPKEEWEDGYDFREPREFIPMLEEWTKKVDLKLTLGMTPEEMVKDPMKPLPAHFRGAKISGEVCMSLDQLAATVSDGAPGPIGKQIEAAVKLAAGFLQEAKIGFDETSAMMLVARLKKMQQRQMEGRYYVDPVEKLFNSCMDKGLQHLRAKIYEAACKPSDEDGLDMIKKGEWNLENAPDKDVAKGMIDLFMMVIKNMTGVNSIIIDGIPNSKLEFHLLFENFNPFAACDYLFGHMPKAPVEEKTSLVREISSDETGRLQAVFDKFDKDKSGAIDVKELKEIIAELGGTATDEEIEEAMKELDANKDGTCCFKEFQTFWCSKSGLGGHNSTMLKFLKMKMQAGSLMSKGASALSRAGGHVSSATEGIFDTVVNFIQELSPGLAEIKDEKMSYTFSLDIEDVKKDAAPVKTMVYTCKNDADATEVKAMIEKMMTKESPMGPSAAEMLEMQGMGPPQFKTDGNKVVITFAAPTEMLEAMVYSQEDMMKIVVPAIKAVRNSGAKVSFMNDFKDFLEAPDTAIPTLFNGVKVSANLSAAAMGKEMMFKLLRSMGPKGPEAEVQKNIAIECFKLFTGAEVTQAAGWHKAAIGDLLALLPEGIEPTPAGLRGMAAMMAPEGPPDEFKEFAKGYLDCIKKIEGIESITLENIALPKEFSQNGKDATAHLRTSFENVKPFALIFYMLEPILEKWGLS